MTILPLIILYSLTILIIIVWEIIEKFLARIHVFSLAWSNKENATYSPNLHSLEERIFVLLIIVSLLNILLLFFFNDNIYVYSLMFSSIVVLISFFFAKPFMC